MFSSFCVYSYFHHKPILLVFTVWMMMTIHIHIIITIIKIIIMIHIIHDQGIQRASYHPCLSQNHHDEHHNHLKDHHNHHDNHDEGIQRASQRGVHLASLGPPWGGLPRPPGLLHHCHQHPHPQNIVHGSFSGITNNHVLCNISCGGKKSYSVLLNTFPNHFVCNISCGRATVKKLRCLDLAGDAFLFV